MKKITLIFGTILTMIFTSCEGPIYHNFKIENKTHKNVEIRLALKENPDSVVDLVVLADSSLIIHKTSEMQGFFSDKVIEVDVPITFEYIKILNDSIYPDKDFSKDTNYWKIDYIPGSYNYVMELK